MGAARTLFLCGDVMVGRGIDQLFQLRSDPRLREAWLTDAREYVILAEGEHGAIGRPVDHDYVWGAALARLEQEAPDARLINLETSITTEDDFWPDKGIHYRLHPANVGVLSAARIDGCALANNHVLDFGRRGLLDTLETLQAAGIPFAGAGRDDTEARRIARIPLRRGGAVRFAAAGTDSSGIPPEWQAGPDTPGVQRLDDLSEPTAERFAERLRASREEGELTVASIHWGTNWGYDVPEEHLRFAHRLVDVGVDVVHGHSSHHPRPLEIYRDRLILYGCGDFISDYEGIRGYEQYRGDLRLMYLPTLDATTGRLEALRLIPFQSHRLALRSATPPQSAQVANTLTEASRRFGTQLLAGEDGVLTVVA